MALGIILCVLNNWHARGKYFDVQSYGDVRQFWLGFGTTIPGMGCTFYGKFWHRGLAFARNSVNA